MSTPHPFCCAESQWLADLTGILADLRRCLTICGRLEEELQRLYAGDVGAAEQLDFQLFEDLAVAALVRYVRAVASSGARRGIPPEWIEPLSIEQKDAHERLKGIRDKHVAHSVNCFEFNRVWAHVDDGTVVDVSCDHLRRWPLTSADLALMRVLAEALIARAESEIEVQRKIVLKAARETAIADLESGAFRHPDQSAAETRPRYDKGRRPFPKRPSPDSRS